VHDAERVCLGQGLTRLQRQIHDASDRQPCSWVVSQIGALEVLEHHVWCSGLGCADINHTRNMLALQSYRRVRFLAKPLDDVLIFQHVVTQELHGNWLLQPEVARLHDDTHPTHAEHSLDAISIGIHGSDLEIVVMRHRVLSLYRERAAMQHTASDVIKRTR
jgi:hypothetical protein